MRSVLLDWLQDNVRKSSGVRNPPSVYVSLTDTSYSVWVKAKSGTEPDEKQVQPMNQTIEGYNIVTNNALVDMWGYEL